jgi:hypothetical protein
MKYNIWSEGYAVQGNSAGPHCHARGVDADSFKEACVKFFSTDPITHASYFDAERMTYWGCKLYHGTEFGRTAEEPVHQNRKIVVDFYRTFLGENRITLATVDGRKHLLTIQEAEQLYNDLHMHLLYCGVSP